MRPLVTPDEMRRADEEAIRAGTSAEVLMERAGRAVARSVLRELGGRYGKKVAVVCGKGNNGGDGFVTARVLFEEGVGVVCCMVDDPDRTEGPARYHLDLLRSSGCPITRLEGRHLHVDVIVDAVFGTGFEGEPRGEAREALAEMTHAVEGEVIGQDDQGAYAVAAVWPIPRIVSIDVPSAGWVPADLIVALGAEKIQTFFDEEGHDTTVDVADIGIQIPDAVTAVFEGADAASQLSLPLPSDHKTSRGTVLVIAGSDRTTGAPILTARGAARMGSGYVTVASTQRVIDAAETLVPEILKWRVAGDALGPGLLDDLSDLIERSDCLAVGPGLGIGDAQRALVLRLLEEFDGPLVLDADALNNLVGHTDNLGGRDWPVVITPHVAEMARMLERPTPEVNRDRLVAALEASDRFDCVVVLKGHRTVVAGPPSLHRSPDQSEEAQRRSAIAIPTGGPELATAGTGDVLTGAVAAQLARGGHPLFTTAAACFVHGAAGAIAAERIGAAGVVAWDVAEALPEAMDRIRGPYAG